MSNKVLVVTYPWSRFINHPDSQLAVFEVILRDQKIQYEKLISTLEFAEVLDKDEYKVGYQFDQLAPKYLELFQKMISQIEDINDIWFVRNDNAHSGQYFKSFNDFLRSKYPDKRHFVFPDDIEVLLDNQSVNGHSYSLYQVSNPDYSSFIERYHQVTNLNQPICLPLFLNQTSNSDFQTTVKERAIKYYVLDYDLGLIDLIDSTTRTKLESIAEWLENTPYDFHWHGSIHPNPHITDFSLLKEAGFKSVEITLASFENLDKEDVRCLIKMIFHLLNTVKKLNDLALDVVWKMPVSAFALHSDLWIQFTRSLPRFYGVTAPEGIEWLDGEEYQASDLNSTMISLLNDSIKEWSGSAPGSILSIGFGPNFSKLFDKRGEMESWRFFKLNAAQTALYKLLDNVCSRKQIEGAMDEISTQGISNFLKFLDDHALIASLDGEFFFNLAHRRKFEEAWVTAEL